MNLETEETYEMVVEGARETVIKLNNDGTASDFEGNKENDDELSNGPCAGNKRDVDSKESEEEVGNQEKDSKAGDDGMFIVFEDDTREENLMGSEDAKDIEALTDAITKNDDTNTTEEVLLLPKKKILKRKKIVKKRKLVKRKVTIAKDEDKSQLSDVPDPTAEVRANQDVKNEETPAGKTINDSLLDKQEFAASVDMQNNEAGLAGEVGDDEMFIVPEDDVREESVMGSEDGKDLESLTDAITMNEKEEALNDDTNTTKDTLLPKKMVLKRKKVLKKRRLVKGKAAMAKDEEKPQSSDMPDPSAEVGPNQYVQNEENLDGTNNLNNSSTVRTKQKNGQQKTGKVSVKSKQTEKNKQGEKEKTASESRVKLSKITLREVTAEDKDGAEPSKKPNSSNKVETMGMIFMCSSKTKEDCYHYKVMGLPAGKKDAVLKVYKGMRLFLFDFELKLLYGIYKAAAPGGYNLEPNAFNSNFPSQVRFTAVRESTPLPEEKFKKVIKDNYYTKNKFSPELNSEQVKSLCKLFQLANKASKSKAKAKAVTERPKVGVRPIVEQEKKRNDERGRERRAVADSGRDNKRRRVVDNAARPRAAGNNAARQRAKGAVVRPDGARRTRLLEDDARRSRAEDNARRSRFEDHARRSRIEDEERLLRADEDARRLRFEDGARRLQLETEERRLLREDDARRDRRHSPLALNDNRYLRHADVYGRETYALPAPLHLDALPPPALPPYASSYTGSGSGSGRTSLLGDYRLDMGIENEDRGGLAYSRPRHLYDYQTPYLPPPREPIVYRDPGYDVSTSRTYYPPVASRDDYLLSSSRTSRYGLSPHRRY